MVRKFRPTRLDLFAVQDLGVLSHEALTLDSAGPKFPELGKALVRAAQQLRR
jgi:hypothetical protein